MSILYQVDKSQGFHKQGCLRFHAESLAHRKAKYDKCCELFEMGHKFGTEIKLENGDFVDVVDFETGECWEFETDPKIDKQRGERVQIIDEQELYKKALEFWGLNPQLDMAIEEMSELTKEICKYKRRGSTYNFEYMANEIVDVELMLEQLKFIFNLNHRVKEIRLEKLEKLRGMLK